LTEPDEPLEAPPEGATCAEHPEREALVTCPRCGSYCCLGCWHGAISRCHACVRRDPGPPVPWEDARRGFFSRYVATLGDAFRPTRAAIAFATSRWPAALSFALLTFVPVALLSGVIPYTHGLVFGEGAVLVLGSPGASALALDIGRASLIGLLVATAKLLCVAVPYQSLSRAYASDGNPAAALCAALYRGWLIPLSELLLGLLVWGLPAEASGTTTMLVWVVSLLPVLLLVSSLLSTARIASGVGPLASLLVVLVPIVLMMVFTPIGMEALRPWLPDPEIVRRASGQG
jgi:hypothetical protein